MASFPKCLMVFVLVLIGSTATVVHSQPPPSQPDEAKALGNRAVELHQSGKTAEAAQVTKRALDIREKTLPAGHPDIAESLYNLAFYTQTLGQLSEAETLFLRALELREKSLAAGHPDIAQSLQRPWRASADPGTAKGSRTAVPAGA